MKQTYLAYSIVIATIITALVGLFFIYTYAPSVSGSGIPLGVACNTYIDNVIIVADQSGFNDSVNHGVPEKYWPFICVKEGSCETIVVKNLDSVQPNGFTISNADIAPGESFTVTLTQPGVYTYHCTFNPLRMISKIVVKS